MFNMIEKMDTEKPLQCNTSKMVGRHANSMKKPRGTVHRGNIWKWLERKGCHPQERKLRRGSQSSVGQRHCTEFHFRNIKLGNFLVGQWLTHCASTAGGVGLIPGWGTKILHAVCYSQERKKKCKIWSIVGIFQRYTVQQAIRIQELGKEV